MKTTIILDGKPTDVEITIRGLLTIVGAGTYLRLQNNPTGNNVLRVADVSRLSNVALPIVASYGPYTGRTALVYVENAIIEITLLDKNPQSET